MSDVRYEICPRCKAQAATETDFDYEVYQCEECRYVFLLETEKEKDE
jgi:Zn-finger nucleic acid-binding protein